MKSTVIQRRPLTAIVACVAMLTLVGIASATTWAWNGRVGVGLGNGQCPLYAGQSACSPYDNWFRNNAAHKGTDWSSTCGGDVLAGFENSSTIRGIYLEAGQSGIAYKASFFSPGASLKGTVTFCTWAPSCYSPAHCGAQNYPANVWFQVTT
jgi:hypothetical protein